MENLKLILDKINNDLSDLEEKVDKSISSKKSEKESGTKKFDKNTIDQISSNLDKLDEIIKRLDEDN
tara:strand:- start:468 stop:668 length:201 start_codon:yes stop_codon:yes gene_type:complete